MEDLHAVFAVTIYGDKIRVTHFSEWDNAIDAWNRLDKDRRDHNAWPIVKWFAIRCWDDPEWNTCRYRSLFTLSCACTKYEMEAA